MTTNTPQSQVSTEEQLTKLQELYTKFTPKTSYYLIGLANAHGLYDAADFVTRKAQQTTDLVKMMTWNSVTNENLEVAWRIYDALCSIPSDDLTMNQQKLVDVARHAAYNRWLQETDLSK